MARTRAEPKPPWRAVPPGVRAEVHRALGSPVVRGTRTWGGFAPTPTYRLRLADGRRAFFKGIYRESNDFSRGALQREARVYGELSGILEPWAPRFYAGFRHEDWHVLLLEDVGLQTVPPWAPAAARGIARAYATFHAATLGADLPAWLPQPQRRLGHITWDRVVEESDDLQAVAALARDQSETALIWLRAALPLLARLTAVAPDLPGPYALLHGDTRSDNLRYRGGHLVLFDWPFAQVGRPEHDLAAFAQSVATEGGPDPDQVAAWYGERFPVRPEALDSAIAWMAAFFADLAWRPDIPGLPRLRPFQRRQLGVVLAWASRRLRLPDPTWVSALR
jgi:hypothetical protein